MRTGDTAKAQIQSTAVLQQFHSFVVMSRTMWARLDDETVTLESEAQMLTVAEGGRSVETSACMNIHRRACLSSFTLASRFACLSSGNEHDETNARGSARRKPVPIEQQQPCIRIILDMFAVQSCSDVSRICPLRDSPRIQAASRAPTSLRPRGYYHCWPLCATTVQLKWKAPLTQGTPPSLFAPRKGATRPARGGGGQKRR